jgi:hypothetical protein
VNGVNPPTSMAEALAHWHDFYVLLGTASATLVGLLFVAATVGAGVFTSGRQSASRIFLSASVVQFGSLLIACLVVLAPGQNWVSLGVMIAACGMFGLAYTGLTWRGTVKEGLSAAIAWDDRVWYACMPATAYVLETVSGVSLALQWSMACHALSLSLGLLMVTGIHNAWDITLWSITRPRT